MDGYIKQFDTGWAWIGRSADKFSGSGHYKAATMTKLVGFSSADEALADAQQNMPGITIVSESEYRAEGERRLAAHRTAVQSAMEANDGRLPNSFKRLYS